MKNVFYVSLTFYWVGLQAYFALYVFFNFSFIFAWFQKYSLINKEV